MDPASLSEFKDRQREMWASFTPTAMFTTPVAGHLVAFAGVGAGEAVLDVGTGTGVVAISAARAGARVTALDLSPELLEQARENGRIAQHEDIVGVEGDAEALPYPDGSFDVVLSQFGHIFAPRPDVVIAEMRRVLTPNGRIAFATWPPEHLSCSSSRRWVRCKPSSIALRRIRSNSGPSGPTMRHSSTSILPVMSFVTIIC